MRDLPDNTLYFKDSTEEYISTYLDIPKDFPAARFYEWTKSRYPNHFYEIMSKKMTFILWNKKLGKDEINGVIESYRGVLLQRGKQAKNINFEESVKLFFKRVLNIFVK